MFYIIVQRPALTYSDRQMCFRVESPALAYSDTQCWATSGGKCAILTEITCRAGLTAPCGLCAAAPSCPLSRRADFYEERPLHCVHARYSTGR